MAVRRLAEPALQPKSFAFTAENLDWAKHQIAKSPEGRQASAILPILWRAQEQAGGWLPQKAIEHVEFVHGAPDIGTRGSFGRVGSIQGRGTIKDLLRKRDDEA